MLGYASKPVQEWLDSSTAFDRLPRGEWGGHTPQILVSVLLWVVVPLVAGTVRTGRRDVNRLGDPLDGGGARTCRRLQNRVG